MIGLCDCNSFYASSEALFRPDLKKRPIVVLSNNDGIIVSLNQEAKKLGLQRGDAWFKVSDWAEKRGCVPFSSNYALYQSLSDRMMQELREITPEIEPYSIDEAFFTPEKDADAEKLARRIIKDTGIPVSVGLARTKTLSKIANHIGKKLSSHAFEMTEDMEDEILSRTPVEEVWGVGRRLTMKLNKLGIRTAKRLREQGDDFILKHFNVTLLRTVYELRGMEACYESDNVVSMQSGISFSHPISDFNELLSSLAVEAGNLSQKLTEKNVLASSFAFGISTSRFKDNYECPFLSFKLPTATNYQPVFMEILSSFLGRIYNPAAFYTTGRCYAYDLVKEEDRPMDMFYDEKRNEKRIRLTHALSDIRVKYGECLKTGLDMGLEQKDLMKRERKSPSYTTRFEELPLVY